VGEVEKLITFYTYIQGCGSNSVCTDPDAAFPKRFGSGSNLEVQKNKKMTNPH
jgi:hypothetical protein